MQGHFPLAKPPEGTEGKCKKILYSKTIYLFYSKITRSRILFFPSFSLFFFFLGAFENLPLLLQNILNSSNIIWFSLSHYFKIELLSSFLHRAKNDSSPDVIMTLLLKFSSVSSWTFTATISTGWILLMESFCFLFLWVLLSRISQSIALACLCSLVLKPFFSWDNRKTIYFWSSSCNSGYSQWGIYISSWVGGGI